MENDLRDTVDVDGPHSIDVSAGHSKQPEKLARMVLRDAIPFSSAALECGYSASTALKGQTWLIANSQSVSAAFARESAVIESNITLLKPLAIKRLHKEIADPDSTQAMRAIELAGRFKETDWFVRNSETNVGILIDIDVENSAERNTFETK